MTSATGGLLPFLEESLGIEGILRPPSEEEVAAAERFLAVQKMNGRHIEELQGVLAPGFPLRRNHGSQAWVGSRECPPGGMALEGAFGSLAFAANSSEDPWRIHCKFQSLHPFEDGNGRTGRMLWAWQMRNLGRDPFRRGFLREFYYQTLHEHDRRD